MSDSDLTVTVVVRSPAAIACILCTCSVVLTIILSNELANVPISSFLCAQSLSFSSVTLPTSISPAASSPANVANFCIGLLIVPDTKMLKRMDRIIPNKTAIPIINIAAYASFSLLADSFEALCERLSNSVVKSFRIVVPKSPKVFEFFVSVSKSFAFAALIFSFNKTIYCDHSFLIFLCWLLNSPLLNDESHSVMWFSKSVFAVSTLVIADLISLCVPPSDLRSL
ncbi:hypothetical protein SDC9_125365 [bioreactor metagenome]|uniref:Uncharacterized protein n=1 Tax=bioreactor metagenome TaxID=1076179 RepID=A0A645CN97_9ZZZZ